MQMQKIKKVASGAIGLFLTGATLMGPALAAADLSDFQNMGPSDTVVVVGASAITADVVGGINIGGKLAQSGIESATCSVSCSDSGVATIADGVKIETSSKKLRLGSSSINGALSLVKSSLAAKDLDLLEKQTVTYADGTSTSVNQVLTLYGNTNVTFSEDDNDGETTDNPRMILRQDQSANMYKLDITSPAGLDINQSSDSTKDDYKSNAPGLASQDIVILGKTFTVGTDTDITSTKLTLFGGGEEKSLTAGGPAISFELDGVTHTFQMTSWTGTGPTLKGVFLLNGVQHEKAENSAITVNAETNSQISIKDVSEVKMPSAAGGAATESATATIFVGSDKLTLENGQAVKIGDDSITGSVVAITADGSKIKTLTVTYSPDETVVAEVGGVIQDPIFKAFDFAFAGVTPTDKDSSKEEFKVYKGSSTKVKTQFTNNQGSEYNIDLKTVSGTIGSEVWTYGGTAGTQKLWVTQVLGDVTKGSSFFISDGTDSYVLKYKSIDTSDSIVTFEDVGTGDEIEVGYTSNAGTLYLGAATFAVADIKTSSPYSIDIADADQGTAGTTGNVVMITKNGANFVVGADSGSAPFVTFTETDDQADTDKAAINVTVAETISGSVGIDSVDAAVSDVAGDAGKGAATSEYQLGDSKLYERLTTYGTYIVDDTDADSILLYYPDDQVTANVYVMKSGVNPPTVGGSDGTTTQSQTVSVSAPSLGNGIAKLDSEVSATDKEEKNLILVGGPAANSLVRDLAAEGTTPDLAYWTANLQGKFILQSVEDAFAAGKSAIVVAGWAASHTQAASLKLATEAVSGAAISCIGTSCADFVYPVPEAEAEPEVE